MGRLLVFNMVSLDGYFVDARGDMGWAHEDTDDAEWQDFVEGNARGGGTLVFGRLTYEMMASWWPSPPAIASMPVVAERMNSLPKLVFSRSLEKAGWNNTRLVREGMAEEIRRLKAKPDEGMAIMGSGSIVSQLSAAGLIDEYQVVVIPIVLGKGRTMFDGLAEPRRLRHTRTRSFANGKVLLCYEPRT